jgi:endonuclease YncB( thermonuclease family)
MIVAGPNDTIPAEWTAAEKAAKKSAIGIWSKP